MKIVSNRLVFFIVALSLSLMVASSSFARPRIIGGGPASEGEYPFMVGLFSAGYEGPEGLFCGGTLIDPQYVVTAAHCVSDIDYDPSSVEVVIGRTKLTSTQGVRVKLAGIIVHPLYDSSKSLNDVALLKLENPVPGVPLQVIGANESSLWAPGIQAKIIGWGLTDPEVIYPAFPDVLQEADVPIHSDSDCENAYGYAYTPASHVCAGKLASGPNTFDGVDTCYGDSGGPLFVSDQNGSFRLVGITSFGFGCAHWRYPGVYTEVAPLASWILSKPTIKPFAKIYPTISGEARVGSQLTCDKGVWGGDSVTQYNYKWFSDGLDIIGATGATYTIVDADLTHYISCSVEAVNGGGAREEFGGEVGPVEEKLIVAAPTPIPDVNAPQVKFLGSKCDKKSCVGLLDVRDDVSQGSDLNVSVSLSRKVKRSCKQGKVCTKEIKNLITASSVNAPVWSFTARRGKENLRYTGEVTAVDTAGNVAVSSRFRFAVLRK